MDKDQNKQIPKARRKPQPYKVGFAKPPLETRFQKGQSGNPSGRPKGKRNMATILKSVSNETLVITENGERKTITKLEASFKQLVNKAASGDHASIKLLIQVMNVMEQEQETGVVKHTNSEADMRTLRNLQQRMLARAGHMQSTNNEGGDK
ncbi:DUF5681 domain-containing protein [Methylotenera sp. 1P/1]|uniref:DUF5681 domain-containing protein n=1 Tax=Methylotenera sp. 1P/1 TaxID=1131551 RepID=UPI0003792807|nr:DUF5681 domain-containing protein [Methylotenera sp. 1P/1]